MRSSRRSYSPLLRGHQDRTCCAYSSSVRSNPIYPLAIHSVTGNLGVTDISRELRGTLPGIAMRRSDNYVQNRYGPFGFASGQSQSGDTCIFAWQRIRPAESQTRWLTGRGTIQICLRLCDLHLNEEQLLAFMYGFSINAAFNDYSWNPYGEPAGPASDLGRPGPDIYPVRPWTAFRRSNDASTRATERSSTARCGSSCANSTNNPCQAGTQRPYRATTARLARCSSWPANHLAITATGRHHTRWQHKRNDRTTAAGNRSVIRNRQNSLWECNPTSTSGTEMTASTALPMTISATHAQF